MIEILVVDDDQGMRDFLEIMLTQEGFAVTCARDGREALALSAERNFALVLTDLKMPRLGGIEFLKRVKENCPETPVIVITGYASGETALTAMQEGAFDYLEKNFDVVDLKRVIRNALAQGAARSDEAGFLTQAQETGGFAGLTGRSKAMLKVYSLIRKVADAPTNVLILGESGTGKELVARAIHDHSHRAKRPFVVINCGGIPEQLLESELFGHMKGSFTGAHADTPGLFETARGGSVFLDEIGELPAVLQVKLLRVIQEKTFRRIGGTADIQVDARIIAATNRDLKRMVEEGRFREDLYYRLNVIAIALPALRERREDLPLLVESLIDKYSRQFGKAPRRISAYAMELLRRYPFPGNIRELQNMIERSVALETSTIILPETPGFGAGDGGPTAPEEAIVLDPGGILLEERLEAMERAYIVKALDAAQGARAKAAELLGINVRSLRYRLEKLGISAENADEP